jgi:hypothetical protein
MWKVVALACLSFGAWVLSRRFRPAQRVADVALAGVRGALLGTAVSATLALLLLSFTPNARHQPFHLSIYLIGCSLLLTPAISAGAVIGKLRQEPDPQEKPSFQGMLDQITHDSSAPPAEEPA